MFSSAAMAETVTFTNSTPLPIPDNAAAVLSTLNVAGVGVVTDVDVSLTFNPQHTFAGDLDIFLTSPALTTPLFTRIDRVGDVGFPDGNNLNGTYILDDASTVVLGSLVASGLITQGTYAPEVDGSLDALNGLNPNGLWTLSIDDQAPGDSGTLSSWSLIITYAAVDQAILGPTIPAIISGDVSSLVGTFADRANARYAGGIEPAADVTNPYLPGGTGGLWMRLGGAKADGSGDIVNLFTPAVANYDKDQWFGQVGLSHVLYDNGDKKWVGSLFGQYSQSGANVADGSGPVGSVDSAGYGVGYSSTWLFDSGFYADSLSMAQWQDIDVATAAGSTGATTSRTLASSIEAGMHFDLGNGVSLTPQVQGIYQRVDIEGFTDSASTTYAFADNNSLVGRAGLGLTYASTDASSSHRTQAGITASVLNQFMDGGATTINGTDLSLSGVDQASWMIAGNVNFTPVSTGFGVGLNASYRDAIGSDGESAFAGDVTASWRW